MFIIGSKADTACLSRSNEKSDWDFICSKQEQLEFEEYVSKYILRKREITSNLIQYTIAYKEISVVEIEVAMPGSTSEELLAIETTWSLQHNLPDFLQDCGITCPPRSVLAQIKRASCYIEHNFEKNINDYHELKTDDMDWEWTSRRTKEQQNLHDHLKTVSLRKSKNEFFDQSADKIKPLYEHDTIHVAIAHPKPPAYTLFLSDEVSCSKDKFFSLSKEDQLRAVIEESCTLALERILIPFYEQGNWFNIPEDKATSDFAFAWGLMRVCTTITSGWFRKFSVENYPDVVAAYRDNYSVYYEIMKFNEDLLKLYENGKYRAPNNVKEKHATSILQDTSL